MTFRAYADNVIIRLDPPETMTASGLHLAPRDTEEVKDRAGVVRTRHKARKHFEGRWATVLASGPGFWTQVEKRMGTGERYTVGSLVFVPNSVQVGDRVLVDALCGQDWSWDTSVPRHNKPAEFLELAGEAGDYRIVREQEILCVIEDEVAAE